MFLAVKGAVDDVLEDTALTVAEPTGAKLGFLSTDLLRYTNEKRRWMQYLTVQKLPGCKDYERTAINVYEFAMAIRTWLRQMRMHNAYYRYMASLPASSASSPGGHTGHAPDLATALQQGGPVLNPAGTLVGQARLMHAVLTHRRSADVFSTGDVLAMIRNRKAVRDTTSSNGPGTARDLAISTCERLLEGGLVDEVSMTKRTKGPQMRYFR